VYYVNGLSRALPIRIAILRQKFFVGARTAYWIAQVMETLADTLCSPPAIGVGAALADIAIRYIG
jgi:hypothetical protein